MTTNNLIIDERQTNLGQFMVGRLLPFRKKRQVGPFTFIDHMGPAQLAAGKYLDVDQHPHIGLSTLTYLIDGSIEHRDSMGSVQVIEPGDVGFMTSGAGVTHTERTPENLRNNSKPIKFHGYQVWVAMPKTHEEDAPSFQFYEADKLPSWETNHLSLTLIAGKAFGKSSPLQGLSHLFMVDVVSAESSTLDLRNQLHGEVAFVIVTGSVLIDDNKVSAGQMLISTKDEQCEICLSENSRILIFGGDPLEEEPLLMWNFVSSDKEKLKEAKNRWINKQFPKVPEDDTYIPFPNT